MSDVFRDLFVELPSAVFEALKGIGERAVLEAQARPRPSTSPTPSDRMGLLLKCAWSRYQWRSWLVHRSEARRAFIIRFVRECGHAQVVEYGEQLLLGNATDAAAWFFDAFDRTDAERQCACIPKGNR